MKLFISSFLFVALSFQFTAANAEAWERVVVAGSSITEVIYQLGAEDKLVGVDTTSVYPKATNELPNIGYLRALSAEGVLSLKPDLLLVTEEAGPVKVLEVLRQAGVNVHKVSSDKSLAGVHKQVQEIAKLLAKPKKAAAIQSQLQQQAEALIQQLEGQAGARVLFLLTHGGRSPMSAGKDTAADALIKLAGGINVVDSFHGYRPLSQEAVAALKPDFILTTEQGLKQIGGAEVLLNRAGINLTPAAQKQQLITMDATYLLGFGPRVLSAAQELAAKLYPQHVAVQD